jgi:uncharacterized protein YabN with tetrapyrrole methylase and pyrophosphatase domain
MYPATAETVQETVATAVQARDEQWRAFLRSYTQEILDRYGQAIADSVYQAVYEQSARADIDVLNQIQREAIAWYASHDGREQLETKERAWQAIFDRLTTGARQKDITRGLDGRLLGATRTIARDTDGPHRARVKRVVRNADGFIDSIVETFEELGD